ncbi:hypothetical protein MKZ38_005919 [Zalerion maritima]|uniref:Uncharacterized protein n=1 Tax=Zalerion maritima TaxID=339359 RepID=A0AAD5WQM7_9PEZI|nr:hypothetical protein MKZ38_005919 [Zalerion maritima]
MGVMDKLRKVGGWIAPPPEKSEADGRDQWPSRAAFILASCGGAVGMGNLLRFPSQVYNNLGLQWFIPYLMAIFLLAIPALALEIACGNAYRGGCVVAYNAVHKRLRGTGMALNYVGFVVVIYFVPILAWIMVYFRASFTSPLPWMGRGQDFFDHTAMSAVEPTTNDDGWLSYPDLGFSGELVGWNAFTWFVVWLCMFRGVGLTGRVVYFTMGLPIIMTIILIGRSCSLDNAREGVKLYFATWHGEKLGGAKIWTDAVGQVFFSTGVGFGYYTAYASYNQQYSNAVQDAVIIVCSNCLFEAVAAFAVFGIVGFLRLWPDENPPMASFAVGFVTYPEAITQMPGANFWAVLFFFTLMLLGISSSFAMLDAVVTLLMDSDWGMKASRPIVATTLVVLCFLLGLPYCTHFGTYFLNGIDWGVNNIALVFVVWAECVGATTIYRHQDVVGQVGKISFYVYNAGFFLGQILGVAVGNAVSPEAGAGVGFGLFVAGLIVSMVTSKRPEALAAVPKLFTKSKYLSAFYYVAFYSGNRLRHDLNLIIGQGKNWALPAFWAPLLRYITCPILAIVFSMAYAGFQDYKKDPMYIIGIVAGHFLLLIVISGIIFPKWFNWFVPADRFDDADLPYAPGVPRDAIEGEHADQTMEVGDSGNLSPSKTPSEEKKVSSE